MDTIPAIHNPSGLSEIHKVQSCPGIGLQISTLWSTDSAEDSRRLLYLLDYGKKRKQTLGDGNSSTHKSARYYHHAPAVGFLSQSRQFKNSI